MTLQFDNSFITSCDPSFEELDLTLMSGVEGREGMKRTSRSIFDSFPWAFPPDLMVVASSLPLGLFTCTFSTPDGANGNLVDMTMV